MLKNIFYFSDERGRCPVMEFIPSLPPDEQAKVYSYIQELRIYLKESAMLVHAIRKKTNKLPERDIKLALKRKAKMQAFRDAGKLLTEDL